MIPESVFLSEWLASNRPNNQLPISAVCNSHCIFCSNHLNPFAIQEGIFRDLEDIKHQLTLMEQYDQPVRLSDSLPGRVSEGEALLHPRLFEILELVRRRFFKNTLCFTTNASLLDEPFLKQLARFRPIEMTVSMHSTQPELWARIFKRSTRAAQTAIDSLARIRAHGFDLIGTIVPLPAICGWEDIERTYDYFVGQGASRMILFHPGYSRRTPPEIVCELQCPLDEYMDFAERMKARHRLPVTVCNDTRSPLNVAVEKVITATLVGNIKTLGGPYRHVLWLSSEAAHARLGALVATHAGAKNKQTVCAVPNHTYGGNISAAGLLTVDDFVRAGQQALALWPDVELILVPVAPFDSLNRDLQGTPAHRIADALQKPVWLMADTGACRRLLSGVFVRPGEADGDPLQRTMKRFNLAWQKSEPLFDFIANWPLETSAGLLDREQFSALLASENERRGQLTNAAERIERLDDTHALCLQSWTLRDRDMRINQWVSLVKRDSHWLIERLLWGKAGD